MKTAEHFNRMALLAGLIWAVILHMFGRIIFGLLPLPGGRPIAQAVSGALFFVAFLAYPTALTMVMQGQTRVWWNAAAHAAVGSAVALIGIFFLSALASGLWIGAVVSALILWLLLQVLMPLIRSNRALKEERGNRRAKWRQLDELQLGRLLFLQIPRLR